MSKNIFYKDCCDKFVDYMKKSHITTQNEPKSEKATQDVQKNCLSLTEQWKKGELKEGEYYVKLESGKIDIYFMVYDDDDCDEIVEIIAEVPSYEEWQDLELEAYKEGWGDGYEMTIQKTKKQCREFYKKKYEKKIHKLKECLKNCRELFDTWDYPNIVKEIDEVLK